MKALDPVPTNEKRPFAYELKFLVSSALAGSGPVAPLPNRLRARRARQRRPRRRAPADLGSQHPLPAHLELDFRGGRRLATPAAGPMHPRTEVPRQLARRF